MSSKQNPPFKQGSLTHSSSSVKQGTRNQNQGTESAQRKLSSVSIKNYELFPTNRGYACFDGFKLSVSGSHLNISRFLTQI